MGRRINGPSDYWEDPLLPVHNFSNLLFVIFIEHTYIIYIHKHRIVYKNTSVNSNIYVVVKSMVIKWINIITHVAESSIITNIEIKTWCGMLGEFVTYTVIKDEVLLTVSCQIFPSILIAKYLFTGSLKNRSIDNLETQKKYISMKNSQFFNYLLYAKSK